MAKKYQMKQNVSNLSAADSSGLTERSRPIPRTEKPAGDISPSQFVKWSGFGGVVGPIQFLLLFTVAGFLRPGYSAVSQAVSDLGVGPMAWLLNVPAVILGIVMIALAVGFFQSMRPILSPAWRWTSAILVALPGFGFVVAGIFTEDPSTVLIHWVVGAILGLYFPVVTFFVVGLLLLPHRVRGYGIYSLIAAVATIAAIVLTSLAFAPGSALFALQVAGLAERVDLVVILAWYVVMGWRLFRTPAAS